MQKRVSLTLFCFVLSCLLLDILALLVVNLKSATIIQYTIKGRFMSR